MRPQAFDIPALGGVLAGGLEQPMPGVDVAGLDRFLGRLDAHAALLVHGDRRARLEVRALGDEDGGEAGVARLEDLVEERLRGAVSMS